MRFFGDLKNRKAQAVGNAPLKNSALLLKTFLFGKNQKAPARSGRIFFFEKKVSPLFFENALENPAKKFFSLRECGKTAKKEAVRLCIIVDNSCDFLDNLSVLRKLRGKRRKGKRKKVEELSTHPLFADNFIHKKIEFIHSEFPVIGLLFLLISYIMIARLKKGDLFEAGYTQFYTIYYYIYQLKENNINKVLPQRERVGKKSAERTGGGRYENHL